MRLVKRAFQEKGISLPDEAREVIFPEAVPIRQLSAEDVEPETVTTNAEGQLHSEANELETQVRRSRLPETGADLLSDDSTARTKGAAAGRPQPATPAK